MRLFTTITSVEALPETGLGFPDVCVADPAEHTDLCRGHCLIKLVVGFIQFTHLLFLHL